MKRQSDASFSNGQSALQVGEQILNILLAQCLIIGRHHPGRPLRIMSPTRSSFAGSCAEGKILMLEDPLQAGTFLAFGGIRPVTAVAVVIGKSCVRRPVAGSGRVRHLTYVVPRHKL